MPITLSCKGWDGLPIRSRGFTNPKPGSPSQPAYDDVNSFSGIIKRLREADRILTPNAVTKLRYVAKKLQGRPYDLTFEWSDDRIYCSELVWKIYDRGIDVQVGRLQKLRNFDLSDPVVKAKMQERYGNRVPMDETVISPGEIFSSKLLIAVIER